MYKYKTRGQYYFNEFKGSSLKNFDETFIMPNNFSVLAKIQNILINKRLLQKDPNSGGYRTCYLVGEPEKLTDSNKKVDFDLSAMTALELKEYAKISDINIKISKYPKISDLRKAIKEKIKENITGIEKKYTKEEEEEILKELNGL